MSGVLLADRYMSPMTEADLDEVVKSLEKSGAPVFMGPMEVYGAKAYAIALNPTQVRTRFSENAPDETTTATPLASPEDTSLHYLAAVLQGQLQPHGDLTALDTNMVVMQILDAARESVRTGKTVTLRPLPQ